MKYKVCDIHSHIAPGIDDGAVNMAMSLEMLRNAYQQGVRNLVCSSHSYGKFQNYKQRIKELNDVAIRNNINIKLHYGSEIYCDEYLVDTIIDALDHGKLPTLNNTDYVLIEFDPHATVLSIINCIVRIITKGYKVVIAHVERYNSLYDNYDLLRDMQKVGCLFQINAYSLNNETNIQIKTFARKLLKDKLVTFIGSDAHRTTHRPYMMRDGIDYIYQYCDTEYARNVCYRNAELFLNMK